VSLIGHDLTQLQNWSLKNVLSVLAYNIPRRSRYEIIYQNFIKEPSRVPVRHLRRVCTTSLKETFLTENNSICGLPRKSNYKYREL
jgi:hypothetical protein